MADGSVAADWSELLSELLQLICSRLESPLYELRLRSVCSSWRSSTPPTPTPTPFLSLTPTFSLSTRTLLLLTPPHHPPCILKLSPNHHLTFTLLHPLSRLPLKPPPFSLDLLSLPALHLAREYLLLSLHHPASSSLFMEKLVLTTTPSPFALLTIHISGKLALFRSAHPDWTIIPDMPTPYDDVCVFRGTFHAVDNTGRTVTVSVPDAALALAAAPIFGGDKKFLVESDGALLLVDLYLSNMEFQDFDDYDGAEIAIEWERTVRFDVFRLHEEEKRWVEVTSLGDTVLFLGDDCAFSASANDLGVGRGNCIIFRDDGLEGVRVQNGMGVFNLDDGKISPLSECPDFAQLFRPPDWARLQLH